MKYIKACAESLKSLVDSALNSRWFLVALGFAAGTYFDPVAMISGISMFGWISAGIFFCLTGYIFYAYCKINQDSFEEF